MAKYNLAQSPLLLSLIIYFGIILIALIIILSIRTDSRINSLIQQNTREVKVNKPQPVTVKKVKKASKTSTNKPVSAYSSVKSVART